MGAENSVLEGCEWADALECPPNFPWELIPITKPDGTTATVFEAKKTETKDVHFLRKNAITLRGLRHPNIVRFIGCSNSSENFWLATEYVTPLVTSVADMSSDELCVGLYDLLQGLDFLHSKLGMAHNNLCVTSIFVSSDGTWKLGGMEHVCKFSAATQEYLDQCRSFRHEDSLSPEEKTNNVKVNTSHGHARDMFAFGTLVESILDLVKEKDDLCKRLEQQLSACVNADPSSRPTAASLLALPVFRSDLVEILDFLRHVTVKNDIEKKEFFSNLLPRLRQLSETAVARRLVVPLLARFVLLDEWADKLVLPHLLMPGGGSSPRSGISSAQGKGLLSETLYRQYVINHLYNIFHVHDNHIRLVLLEHFPHYVHLFTRDQLEDDIFMQVLLGVRDMDDRLVAASLKALADLVPILGGDFVIGGTRKSYFFHGMPKQVSPEDLLKMETPHNMNSVLSSHKPLLKHLAAGASINTSAVDQEKLTAERERKAREREKRREEAKLKREERRRKFKEKQLEENQDEESKTAEGEKDQGLTIEEVADLDNDDLSLKKNKLKQIDADSENENGDDDSLKKLNKNGSNDVEEEEADEDSDWEDADQRISDEIELELQGMTTGSVGSGPKVQTSPSPYRSHSPPSPPPVKVDWSDVPEADRSLNAISMYVGGGEENSDRGPLNLGTKSKRKSQEHVKTLEMNNTDNDLNFTDDWGADDWNSSAVSDPTSSPDRLTKSPASIPSSSPVGNKSLKLKQGKGNKPQGNKSTARKVNDDFGAGLDIKSIEIQAKSVAPELDFFADMAPSIPEKKSGDFLSLMESKVSPDEGGKNTSNNNSPFSVSSAFSATSSVVESVRTSNTQLFAVDAAGDEDTKGWGDEDDLDWGNDDF